MLADCFDGKDHSAHAMRIIGAGFRAGFTFQECFWLVKRCEATRDWLTSEAPRDHRDIRRQWEAVQAAEGAFEADISTAELPEGAAYEMGDTGVIGQIEAPEIDSGSYNDFAKGVLRHCYSLPGGVTTLLRYSGEFRYWNGTHYASAGSEAIRAVAKRFIERAWWRETTKDSGQFQARAEPATQRLNNVIDLLACDIHWPTEKSPPCWLRNAGGRPAAGELIGFQNGLLHWPTKALLPYSPDFFSINASLPYAFDLNAGEPETWNAFMQALWPDDPESIEALEAFIGCMMQGEVRHQKVLVVKGPTRGGKGTIRQVIEWLLGDASVYKPTGLGALAEQWGTEGLISKRACLIPDAKIDLRNDRVRKILEIIQMFSGQDSPDIPRKNEKAWRGQSRVLFTIFTNQSIAFDDSAGAFHSRLLLLKLTRSWQDNPDLGLQDRLFPEIPQIALRCLKALDRLLASGGFKQPASAEWELQYSLDRGSPVVAFLRDCCEQGWDKESFRVLKGDLVAAFMTWQGERVTEDWLTDKFFINNLGDAVNDLGSYRPELTLAQKAAGETTRREYYTGVRLNAEWQARVNEQKAQAAKNGIVMNFPSGKRR
jgi:putative DNA primase/helicase